MLNNCFSSRPSGQSYRPRTDYFVRDLASGHVIGTSEKSTPQSEWIAKLREEPDHPRIVILDEGDQLEDEKVFYELSELPAIPLVCIANREEGLFSGMDSRTRSRVVIGRRVEFDG